MKAEPWPRYSPALIGNECEIIFLFGPAVLPSNPGLGVLLTVTSKPRNSDNPLFVFKHLEPLCPRQSVSTAAAGRAACGRGAKRETADVCIVSSLPVRNHVPSAPGWPSHRCLPGTISFIHDSICASQLLSHRSILTLSLLPSILAFQKRCEGYFVTLVLDNTLV